MDHHGGVHLRILQQAVFDHIPGAFKCLLCRLEHELNGALDLLLVVLKQLCCTQQHSGMHIVSAGVHSAIGRGKFHLGFFPNGQCIHIRPKQEHFSFPFPAGNGYKSGLPAGNRLIAHFSQHIFHIRTGILQVKSGFGMRMQVAPVGFEGVLKLQRFFHYLFCRHGVVLLLVFVLFPFRNSIPQMSSIFNNDYTGIGLTQPFQNPPCL